VNLKEELEAYGWHIPALQPVRLDNGQSGRMTLGGCRPCHYEAIFTEADWAVIAEEAKEVFAEHAPVTSALLRLGDAGRVMQHEKGYALQYETFVDSKAESGKPVYTLTSLPLPLTFNQFPTCRDEVKRLSRPIPKGRLATVAVAFRKVAQAIDNAFLGLTPPVYGFGNTPERVVRSTLKLNDAAINSAVETLKERNFWGPYIVVTSDDTDAGLLGRLKDSRRCDVVVYKCSASNRPRTFIVQATPDVVRAVRCYDLTLLHPEPNEFVAFACIVPQLRKDYYRNIGIAEVICS
jgi:hypothetical protein